MLHFYPAHARNIVLMVNYVITLLDSLFLTQRKQCVVMNSHFSKFKDATRGVPQGSVLGPLLFTVYVNNLPSWITSILLLFVDDTSLIYCVELNLDVDQLQGDSNTLTKWSKLWLLSLVSQSASTYKLEQVLSDASYTLGDVLTGSLVTI